MERKIFETEDFPKIVVENIDGSLRIKGWDRNSLRVESELPDSTKIDHADNTFTINSDSNCILRVPLESEILIENIDGDLVVKSIDNYLKIENVNGQVILKGVGATVLENVNGNFSSKHIEGDLTIEMAEGNVMVRDVEGTVSLEKGMGNFNFAGISTKLNINTEGNANISLQPEFDGVYSFEVGGNINCHLESTLKGKVNLTSQAEVIQINTKDHNEIVTELEFNINPSDQEYELTIEAEGQIDFVDLGRHDFNGKSLKFDKLFDMKFNEDNLTSLADDITQQVTDNIGTSIDSITDQINIIVSNIGKDKASVAKARKQIKNKKIELRHLAKAQREVAHNARRSALKARKGMHHKTIIRHHSIKNDGKKTDPVSDVERQMILQMLQDKKIDINQAEVLLAALEGKEFTPPVDQVDDPKEQLETNLPDFPEMPEIPELPEMPEIPEIPGLADLEELTDLAGITDNSDDLDTSDIETEDLE